LKVFCGNYKVKEKKPAGNKLNCRCKETLGWNVLSEPYNILRHLCPSHLFSQSEAYKSENYRAFPFISHLPQQNWIAAFDECEIKRVRGDLFQPMFYYSALNTAP